jgi:hypothetical protein
VSGKFALIIGNTEYIDPGLAQLTAPGRDAEDFARVLQDQNICSFEQVNILLNQLSSTVIEAIDEFFDQKKPDDLLVLYFSGHGVRDELGSLYLAVRNTIRTRLRSTAIKSDYIREAMDQSRSKRQVLILDCYNSGSYAHGTKAATGGSIGTATAFESGYGRIIMTASDATQFAWKGDKVIGETKPSLFTHFLVEGMEGEADLDGDGRITVDELYDYAYEKVRLATPKQTPSKFTSKQQGEIILRQNMRLADIKPVPLPAPLLDSIDNPFPDVRLGAVQQLVKMLNGKNLGLARSAREALERIVEQDDSRMVSHAAFQALEAIRRAEQPPERETVIEQQTKETAAQLFAEQEAEDAQAARRAQQENERIEREKAEPERLPRQEAESLKRTQVALESAQGDATLIEAKIETTKKTDVESTVIEAPQRLPSKMKLEEERVAKTKMDTVALGLSKVPESRALNTSAQGQGRRSQIKKTPTSSAVSSAPPKPLVGGWSWSIVALIIAGAFALLAAVGGFLWWRASASTLQETSPPLAEATEPDLTTASDPTDTPFSTNTPDQTIINVPESTNPPEPIIPFFTATRDMFCYDGPGTSYDTHWELYVGQTAEVFAKWSGNSDWLVVDINEPAQTRTDCCWVRSSNGTLNVSLDEIETTSIVPDRMDCSPVK